MPRRAASGRRPARGRAIAMAPSPSAAANACKRCCLRTGEAPVQAWSQHMRPFRQARRRGWMAIYVAWQSWQRQKSFPDTPRRCVHASMASKAAVAHAACCLNWRATAGDGAGPHRRHQVAKSTVAGQSFERADAGWVGKGWVGGQSWEGLPGIQVDWLDRHRYAVEGEGYSIRRVRLQRTLKPGEAEG